MEGIASVLRKCQNLANVLQNLKYWALLVQPRNIKIKNKITVVK